VKRRYNRDMSRTTCRETVEAQLHAALAERADIAAVYLFGSVGRGDEREGSDVDVGVLYVVPPPPTLDGGPLDLEADLEVRLGRPVQLVVLNTAPADLRIRVLRAERLVVDQDRSSRIRFEVATRNEFFDLEPILIRYRAPREARS
jgi:predicted nucleotidyltransferase